MSQFKRLADSLSGCIAAQGVTQKAALSANPRLLRDYQ
jgi:hypothetical protein